MLKESRMVESERERMGEAGTACVLILTYTNLHPTDQQSLQDSNLYKYLDLSAHNNQCNSLNKWHHRRIRSWVSKGYMF